MRAAYLVGCDGGRSLVRKAAGIEFAGVDASTSWLIAEVQMAEEPALGMRHDEVGIHAMMRLGDGGPVRLVLQASSSAVDTDFAGKLVDVHPTGFCQRLCDGIIRARYRNGPDKPELIEPGLVYEFDLDLWNTAHVFKAGHRIRLEVASSAFPKFDRNLNTGEDIGTGTRMVRAENRVWHDAEHPSRLILPVIPPGG